MSLRLHFALGDTTETREPSDECVLWLPAERATVRAIVAQQPAPPPSVGGRDVAPLVAANVAAVAAAVAAVDAGTFVAGHQGGGLFSIERGAAGPVTVSLPLDTLAEVAAGARALASRAGSDWRVATVVRDSDEAAIGTATVPLTAAAAAVMTGDLPEIGAAFTFASTAENGDAWFRNEGGEVALRTGPIATVADVTGPAVVRVDVPIEDEPDRAGDWRFAQL